MNNVQNYGLFNWEKKKIMKAALSLMFFTELNNEPININYFQKKTKSKTYLRTPKEYKLVNQKTYWNTK